MKYKNILVTGGAGFVGSNISCSLKRRYSNVSVTAYDNLHRKGSELTLPRLEKYGVKFVKGDVRDRDRLQEMKADLIIECSAEPSVMAGVDESPEYLVDTNLGGAINCFELARKNGADIIFLSTSRIYPVPSLLLINLKESRERFELAKKQTLPGISKKGISEQFPLEGHRTMYGATKLSSELLLAEYVKNYSVRAVVGRFGLIAGPWQFGKVDQGVVTLWVARHVFGRQLRYIGFGGTGKQVRDVLHIDDCVSSVETMLKHMSDLSGGIFNIGGGAKNAISLKELTHLCREQTGKSVRISSDKRTRQDDIPYYVSDFGVFKKKTGWTPAKSLSKTVSDIYDWVISHSDNLHHVIS